MRSEVVLIVYKTYNILANVSPTAHPRVMEAIDLHCERVKLFFNEVPVGIVDPTAQS